MSATALSSASEDLTAAASRLAHISVRTLLPLANHVRAVLASRNADLEGGGGRRPRSDACRAGRRRPDGRHACGRSFRSRHDVSWRSRWDSSCNVCGGGPSGQRRAIVLSTTLSTDERITTAHRAKLAYVYVRQSSPGQVRHHQESTELQYRLVERADLVRLATRASSRHRRRSWQVRDVQQRSARLSDADRGSRSGQGRPW